ncbi:MAG: caspase family protein [Bacteroidales bacterium]|nr:caspase family protein [Bacteroidales bacterium]
MKQITILLMLSTVLSFCSFKCQAQYDSENTVNYEYKETIHKKITDEVNAKQRLMQKKAEQILINLPLDQKLYDESEVKILAHAVYAPKEDGSHELNYVMEISYNCTHIEGVTDDYPEGTYTINESNSMRAICNLTKTLIEEDCGRYFGAGKEVDIRITGATDAIDVAHIAYKGEYGDHKYEPVLFNGEKVRMSLLQSEGINNNAQLAWVRVLGVRDFIENNIQPLHSTNNHFSYEAFCTPEVGSLYRRCTIHITVHDAWSETISSMSENMTTYDDHVDINIPTTANTNNGNTYALIIANENYGTPFPTCKYAANDGKVMRDYFTKTLGIPERHVKVLNNATKGEFKTNGIDWLKDIITAEKGNANIILYYAGHGLSDGDYNAYLLPCGINTSSIKSWSGKKNQGVKTQLSKGDTKALLSQCISIDTLCNWFNRVQAKGFTFIIDAGFDGFTRTGDTLVNIQHTSGRIKGMRIRSEIVLFTAADVNKTAYCFDAQKHGFLTYFMLREFKHKKGDITYGEMFRNIEKFVGYESSLQGLLQEPIMVLGGKTKDTWEGLRFK